MFCLSILLTLVFSLFLLPKNPLFDATSELVFTNVLYSNKSVALFLFPEVSVNAPSWIWTLIWLVSLGNPEPLSVIVYWSPILVVPSAEYTGVAVPTFTETFVETSFPFIRIFILSAVKALLAKYLSVPLTVIVAVWFAALADELTLSHIGSTTSTTVPVTGFPFIYKYKLFPSYIPLIFVFSPTVKAVSALISIYLFKFLLNIEKLGTPFFKYIPAPPPSQLSIRLCSPDTLFIDTVISKLA